MVDNRRLYKKIIDRNFSKELIDWSSSRKKYHIKDLDLKKMRNNIIKKTKNLIKKPSNLSDNELYNYKDFIGSWLGAEIISNKKIISTIDKVMIMLTGVSYFQFKNNEDYQRFIILIINYRIGLLKLRGGIKEYQLYLENNLIERKKIISYITPSTNHFFRDHIDEELAKLKRYFPKIINVLIIGCSTGGEVYSVAYSLNKLGIKYKILSTDINAKAVFFSKLAKYPMSIIKEVESNKALELFNKKGFINNIYRKKVHFKVQDLRKLDFKEEYDLILIRNVLKYFDKPLQKVTINRVINHLRNKGVIVLGIQKGSNADVNLAKFIKLKKIGNYSFIYDKKAYK